MARFTQNFCWTVVFVCFRKQASVDRMTIKKPDEYGDGACG
jgi:hypothetical protein